MRAPPDAFLDTNVLVHVFCNDRRAAAARALPEGGGCISVPGLNEFANVARRKPGMTWPEMRAALAAIRTLCHTVLTVDVALHLDALHLSERDGIGIFDALIVAAARRAGCPVLWSEDMQHGRVIDGQLRIANPFR